MRDGALGQEIARAERSNWATWTRGDVYQTSDVASGKFSAREKLVGASVVA